MPKTIKIHDPNNGATGLFAKLLASEDITVRHEVNAPTACFDVKQRQLTLPMWQGASKSLYDMLVGHEVAHALYTPAVKTEADFIKDLRKVHKNLSIAKQYINVVEDARIERRIKAKFPGLRHDFHDGYAEMHDRDFFGLGDDDPNTLSLIDRLNVHFKMGIHTGMEVEFNAEERPFVTRMEDTETWDDVLTLARDLAEWSEEQDEGAQQEQQEDDEDGADAAGGDSQQEMGEATANFGGEDTEENGEDGEGESTPEGDESDSENDDAQSQDDTPADSGDETNEDGTAAPSPAESKTQQAQERAMEEMAENAAYMTSPQYLTAPELNMENVVVTIDQIDEYLSAQNAENRAYHMQYSDHNEFMKTAKGIVGNMVKQFEMKKAADLNKRASVSRTGVIDPMRLTRYKFDDDLFLRHTIIPNGKNHGMIMLVDWSSSMSHVLGDTLKQAIVLAMFCKKLNIPFDVYAFSSGRHLVHGFNDKDFSKGYWGREQKENFTIMKDFNESKHVPMDSSFSLLHLLSSTSKKNTWMKSLKNALELTVWQPGHLSLGSTPLDQSLIAMPQVIREFQRINKAQVMNLIVLTDGETTGSPLRYGNHVLVAKNGMHCGDLSRMARRGSTTTSCLRFVYNETGCNLLGLFVTPAKSRHLSFNMSWDEREKAIENLKKDNYYQNQVDGYHAHFMVKSEQLIHGDIFDGLSEDASPTKIRNTFIKQLGSRKKAFNYTNRFVDMICSIQGGL